MPSILKPFEVQKKMTKMLAENCAKETGIETEILVVTHHRERHHLCTYNEGIQIIKSVTDHTFS